MKHRLERVNELIKRELSATIARELTFANALVTVHAVDVSPDLKHAGVFVSVIGNEAQTKAAMSKLDEHRAELQREISKRVILKYTPQLHFHHDESIERGARVMDILNHLDAPNDESKK